MTFFASLLIAAVFLSVPLVVPGRPVVRQVP